MSSSPAPSKPNPPRASATLIVVRDAAPAAVGEAGAGPSLEVLLLARAERGDHNSGAWVFPGGIVDARDARWHACVAGLDDAAASTRLGVERGGLDAYIAAARECFEEAGLLFAVESRGDSPASSADSPAGPLQPASRVDDLQHWRGPLHRGERGLDEFCAETSLKLALDRFAYFSHWLTPPGRMKRFDTRFFLALAPAGQVAAHDDVELKAHRWVRPADALAEAKAQGDGFKLMGPTIATLMELKRFANAQAAFDWAAAPREVPLIAPRMGTGSKGVRPVLPQDPAWAEIARIDPNGDWNASYEINPGVAVWLSPRVLRVPANNGSQMTGPGTNSYFVGGGSMGGGRNEWALIDPGPDDAAHVQALLAHAPGPVRWIFATHTHKDHSPATLALKAATGAQVFGRVADHPEWQDQTFVPDVALQGGERFALDGATLRAVHTPGHASNHICYLLEEEKTLFTGDHVMQGSTVVINPPDGDMSAYLASLRSLLDEDLEWLAPGHGFLIAQPRRAIEALIAHRLKREAKVAAALTLLHSATLDALLARVYDDVPERLHAMARRSLLAHLLKLRDDGRARGDGERWVAVEASGLA